MLSAVPDTRLAAPAKLMIFVVAKLEFKVSMLSTFKLFETDAFVAVMAVVDA